MTKFYTFAMYINNMVMDGKQFEGGTLTYGRLRYVSLVPTDEAGSWE